MVLSFEAEANILKFKMGLAYLGVGHDLLQKGDGFEMALGTGDLLHLRVEDPHEGIAAGANGEDVFLNGEDAGNGEVELVLLVGLQEEPEG